MNTYGDILTYEMVYYKENQKHTGYKKCKVNQKQQSKYLYVITRFDMKLRPRILDKFWPFHITS